MVLTGYENHCRDLNRCGPCPIAGLARAADRIDASNVVGSVVNDPNYEHLGHASVGEVMGMAEQSTELFQKKQFAGVVAGALVLTATGNCKLD